MLIAKATWTALWVTFILAIVCIPIAVAGFWLAAKQKDGNNRVNCVPEPTWSEWSECSTPCVFSSPAEASGVQFRTRAIQTLPRNGGTECVASDLLQSQSCNGNVPCGQPCIPDVHSNAYAWSGCPSCVPQGGEAQQWRFVPPLQEAGPYGTPCALSDIFQTSVCTDITEPCPESQNCSMSDVLYSTSCNVSCGHGVQLLYRKILYPATGGGMGCEWEEQIQQQACVGVNGPNCSGDPGCDPSKETWTNWSACDATCGPGWQWATRSPVDAYDTCPLLKSQSCVGYDATCTSLAPSTTPCTPPSDLELDTACYMLCAGMALPPQTDVTVCSITSSMLKGACGGYGSLGGGCMKPQNCEMSPWSAWGECSVGGCDAETPSGGVQVATRSVTTWDSGNGIPCTDPRFFSWITQPCDNVDPIQYMSLSADGFTLSTQTMPAQCVPQNCVLSPWTPSAPCNVLCGSGWQPINRFIADPETGGGTCSTDPADFVSSQTCDTGVTCSTCTFWKLADYETYCAVNGCSLGWSPCVDDVHYTFMPVSVSASPGGSCDIHDGYVSENCTVIGGCPVGYNKETCTGAEFGTCDEAMGTCTCNAPYTGLACGNGCPVNYDGSACGNASGLGSCTTIGVCECAAGISGAACEVGGWCAVTSAGFYTPVGITTTTITVPVDASFPQNACKWLASAISINNPGSSQTPTVVPTVAAGCANGAPLSATDVSSYNETLQSMFGTGGMFPGTFLGTSVPTIADTGSCVVATTTPSSNLTTIVVKFGTNQGQALNSGATMIPTSKTGTATNSNNYVSLPAGVWHVGIAGTFYVNTANQSQVVNLTFQSISYSVATPYFTASVVTPTGINAAIPFAFDQVVYIGEAMNVGILQYVPNNGGAGAFFDGGFAVLTCTYLGATQKPLTDGTPFVTAAAPPTTPNQNPLPPDIGSLPYSGRHQLSVDGLRAGMAPVTVPITHVGISDMLQVFLSVADGHYTRMFRVDGQSKYAVGDVTSTFDGSQWDTYTTPGGPFWLV